MPVSLRRLEYFVAVAEELHFGRAAARSQVSQPGLSRQLRELERELGVALVERSSRSVALTPAGADLLDHAREVLARADELAAAARAHAAPHGRPLVVGFTGSAAGELLPLALQRLRSRHPGVTLALRELTGERYELVRSGELDVVLGRLRPEEMPDLDVTVLAEELRVAALWDGHPLAARESIRLRELAPDGFITQPEALNPVYRASWLAEQHAHGLPARIVAEASSIQEVLNLVAMGRGVCLGPAAAARFNPWPGVVYVPVHDAAPLVTSVVTRREHDDPAIAAFVDAARRALAPADLRTPA